MMQSIDSCSTNNYAAQLGKIILASNGVAKKISSSGKQYKVYAQASNLEPLQINDEVLFFETSKGPFILARALGNDMPKQQLQFGNAIIKITPQGDIILQTSKAKLILTNNGEILIDGKNIHIGGWK